MARPLKRTAKGPAHPSYLADRRRAKTAGRLVTGLVTDMLQGSGIEPNGADKAPRRVRRLAPSLRVAAAPQAATPAPLGLTADATDKLEQGAQSFGDVLRAIGNAVVVSQAALDEAAIETARQLSQTKLEVAVAVRQDLDDSGDLINDPVIDTRTLSLSSFILPTLHQWQHVAASMDLTVGEIDATAGIKVKSGGASVSASKGAVGFSAAAAFNYSSIDAQSRFKAEFSTGAVRLDALLAPREEFRFPDITDFAIGPQILVAQVAAVVPAVPAVAAVAATATTAAIPGSPAVPASRRVTLTIKLLNSLGQPLAGSIDVRLPPDLRRRITQASTGTLPIALGGTAVVLNLDPKFSGEPTQDYRVPLKYGDLTKLVDVTL